MPSTLTARQTQATDQIRALSAVALAVAVCLVGVRLILAVLDRTELSTDEAQYWFWGQDLDFGAYSKPPLIGWIIRLSTDLFGHSVWAVRLPSVLLHALAAAAIFAFARRIAPRPVPELAALLYLLAPGVALGSALMTTDTPLLLAAAVALLAQWHLGRANAQGHNAPGFALVLGLALGLGLLAKYAMLFWLLGALGAALLSPKFRPARTDALLAATVLLLVVAPHLVWLYQNGFITAQHVQDITDGAGLSVVRPLGFLAEQLLVAGPIVAIAIVIALLRLSADPGLAVLTLAPLLIIIVQAVRGPVLANWAVLYLVPGSVVAAQWLIRHPRLAGLSLSLGLAVSLALPLLKVFGTDLLRADGRPVLSRYLGHSEVADWAQATALSSGSTVLVAQDRDLLAALSWSAADTNMTIRAVPPSGRPTHHWELVAPFDPATDGNPRVLLRATVGLPCPGAQELARLLAPPGFAGGQVLVLFRLPEPFCLLGHSSQKDTE
jgi:4-amino-4-deoxy-L-arabinose transferase-like glycosyltransferase